MDAARRLTLFFTVALCFAVAACGPEPTPLPVVISTPTSLPESVNVFATDVPDDIVQYVVDPIAAEILTAVNADSGATPVVQVLESPRLTGNPLEIVISSQSFEGSQQLPALFLYGVALNAQSSPLDSPDLMQAMLEYLRLLATGQREDARLAEAQRLTRETLANAGYPDGIRLNISDAIPLLFQDLANAGIQAVLNVNQPLQIEVVFGDAQREAAVAAYGEDNVIYGFELPLYYATSPDLQIALGDDGLPVLADQP